MMGGPQASEVISLGEPAMWTLVRPTPAAAEPGITLCAGPRHACV